MEAYFYIKDFTASEDKWFKLNTSSVKVEKVPLIIKPVTEVDLQQVYQYIYLLLADKII